MKNDKKLLIRHRNREWGAKHPVINTVEMLKWAHSNKDDSDSTTTVSDDRNATETEIKSVDPILKVDSNLMKLELRRKSFVLRIQMG